MAAPEDFLAAQMGLYPGSPGYEQWRQMAGLATPVDGPVTLAAPPGPELGGDALRDGMAPRGAGGGAPPSAAAPDRPRSAAEAEALAAREAALSSAGPGTVPTEQGVVSEREARAAESLAAREAALAESKARPGSAPSEVGVVTNAESVARSAANTALRGLGTGGIGAVVEAVAPGTVGALADRAVPTLGKVVAPKATTPDEEPKTPERDPWSYRPAGGGGGAVAVIPGHRTPGQWQVQETQGVAPGAVRDFISADEHARRAAEISAAAGKEEADKQAAFALGFQRQKEFHDEQASFAADRRQKRFDAAIANYDKAIDATASSGPFDKSAGAIMGALAMALGAYAQPVTGHNAGAEALKATMDRSMADQRATMEREGNKLSLLTKQLGSEEEAEKVLRIAMIDRAKTQLDALTAGSKSESVLANRDAVLAKLDTERAQLQQHLRQIGTDKVVRTDVMSAPVVIGGGGVGCGRKGMDPGDEAAVLRDLDEHPLTEKEKTAMTAYAKELEVSKLPTAIQSLANAQLYLNAYDANKDIKGVSAGRDHINPVLSGWIQKNIPDAFVGETGRLNRVAFTKVKNDVIHAVTGAGGSKEEMARIVSSLEGAGTTAELAASLRAAQASLEAQKMSIDAGVDPRVRVAHARARRALQKSKSYKQDVTHSSKPLTPTPGEVPE